jgi:perosamine synthetase
VLTAISRYGARVLPNTQQLIAALDRRGELLEGPHIAEFEAAFSSRLGGPKVMATSFGRMAFYYILKALDFPAGSEIVMPALTFWVMPEIARVAGLTPVFADVDPHTFNMTPETAARVISPRTVAIVPTHLWGLPCDMDGILDLARGHSLAVIEDCAHALGALYKGQPVGTLGTASIFSFQTLKPLNTYGGGMAVTGDAGLAVKISEMVRREPLPNRRDVQKKLWQGRVQRIVIRPGVFTWTLFPVLRAGAFLDKNPDVYFWEAIRSLNPLPRHYRQRYSNVQAALGLEALRYIDEWTARTQAHAARVTSALSAVPGAELPRVPADRTHVFYQYCVYGPPGLERDDLVVRCVRRGIDVETLHVDVPPDMELFQGAVAEAAGGRRAAQAMQIPIYAGLTREQIDRVAGTIRDVLAM